MTTSCVYIVNDWRKLGGEKVLDYILANYFDLVQLTFGKFFFKKGLINVTTDVVRINISVFFFLKFVFHLINVYMAVTAWHYPVLYRY